MVDLVLKQRVTEQTRDRWGKKYGGMRASETKRHKALKQ